MAPGVSCGCQFAVRSGGHTPHTGSANIESGVTIDLQALNQVVVNDIENVASVGPGARWADIYTSLLPRNLTVVGGRSKTVGAGGLLTGGMWSIREGAFPALTIA